MDQDVPNVPTDVANASSEKDIYAKKEDMDFLKKMMEEMYNKFVVNNPTEKDTPFITKAKEKEKADIKMSEQQKSQARMTNYLLMKDIMIKDDPEYEATFEALEVYPEVGTNKIVKRDILEIEPETLFNFCKRYYDIDSDALKYRTAEDLRTCEKILSIDRYDEFKVSYDELKLMQSIVDIIRKDNHDKNIISEKNSIFNSQMSAQQKDTPKSIIWEYLTNPSFDKVIIDGLMQDASKKLNTCYQKRQRKSVNLAIMR